MRYRTQYMVAMHKAHLHYFLILRHARETLQLKKIYVFDLEHFPQYKDWILDPI